MKNAQNNKKMLRAPFKDPYFFALALNVIILFSAVFYTQHSLCDVSRIWITSFWKFSSFTLHITMTFVLGYALVSAPCVSRILDRLIGKVGDIYLIPVSMLCVALLSLLNWGVGLLSSAVLCRRIMHKKRRVHYPLLIISAYSGFLVWHGGLTGSAPLLVASQTEIIPGVPGPIPLTETIFADWHLWMLLVVVLSFSAVTFLTQFFIKKRAFIPKVMPAEKTLRLPHISERSVTVIFAVTGLVACFYHLMQGMACDLEFMNVVFFLLALALQGGWSSFTQAVREGIYTAVPILIQFPLYAAISGVMQHTSLGAFFSEMLIEGSSKELLPFWTFLSAGILNIFIPSGGGQWMVQGPVVLKAAQSLNVSYPKVIMALAWGDAWTNLIQPFWMLPVMHICDMVLKDVMLYAVFFTLISGVLISLFFIF